MKPTLLHMIYNLGRGGAETMLVTVLNQLPEYRHVVVTLESTNHFEPQPHWGAFYCLNAPAPQQLPGAAFRLRRIIKKEQPALVHTHLFWPTFLARMAVPRSIPLITTIHAFIATSIEYRHRHIRLLDRISYRWRSSHIVAVAEGARNEYFDFLKLPEGPSSTLYTFADVQRFKPAEKAVHTGIRLVSTGAMRPQKNQQLMIRAMHQLRELPVSLDIYGDGPLRNELEELLLQFPGNVQLKGSVPDIEYRLPQYDGMLMSSHFEGFSLAVLEGMACGLPLLLSDISSFREQCAGTAWYFRENDEADLISQIRGFIRDEPRRRQLAELGYQRCQTFFTLEQHLHSLRQLYQQYLP